MHSNKKYVLVAALAILAIGGAAVVVAVTTENISFSVVMSQSMQHDNNRSSLGVIDTGDVVLVRDVEHSNVESYVKGTQTGKYTFGDYGSVIIYERGPNVNPVIHRAIVWIDYDPINRVWSSEDLKGYEGEWYCITAEGNMEKDYSNLSGTLYFTDITQSKKNVNIGLNSLTSSGFLTMGDNVANGSFDQKAGIIGHTIAMKDIRSIPFQEIPWLGTLKIYFKNDGANLDRVPNSMPSLFMCVILVFLILFMVDVISIKRNDKHMKDELDTIIR